MDWKQRFTSRKFLLTLFACVVFLLKALGIITADDEALWQLFAAILAFLGFEGSRDIVAAWQEGRLKVERARNSQ